jgi:hypothetical protein
MKRVIAVLFVIIVVLSGVLTGCELLEMLDYDSEIAKIVKDENPNACADLKADDERKTKIRQDKCYKQVAFAMKRTDLCDKVEDINKQEDCFIDLAEDLGNLQLCDKVTNGKNECMAKVAIAEQDDMICDNIQGSYKNKCYGEIGKLKLSVEICKRVDSDFEKTNCISHIATTKKDISICDEIKEDRQFRCINAVAFEKGDPEICKQSKNKDPCFSALARKNKDSQLCKEIYDDDSTDHCFEDLAEIKKDPSLCILIRDRAAAYNCIKEFAKEDASACEHLQDEYKEDCQKEFGYTV